MLFNFLTIGYTDNPEQPGETFYEEIEKLPAASWLRLSADVKTLTIQRYWNVDPNKTATAGDAQDTERFAALFTHSVQNRLRSDVGWGCTLSGGLDSSSVTAVAASSQAGIRTKTFSILFPGFEKNEQPHLDAATQHLPLESFTTELPDTVVASTFEKVVRQQDEPFTSSSLLAQYHVFGLAAQHGVKVLLDGQGADELLGGYHKYYKWYWQELFRRRELIKSREIASARALGINEPFGTRNIIAALFPDIASVVLEKQYLVRALSQKDLDRDFVRLQSREAYYSTPGVFSLNGALHFNTFVHGLEELLRYADRNSMAHGRELRLPFLNAALVEFVFSLPGNFKIRDGWNKWILRKAMEPMLPAAITWRKDKIGLEPPQSKWMQMPSMTEMIHEAKRKLVSEKILQPAVLQKATLPGGAYDKNTDEWKYLVAAQYV
jgi:asparagine synthase (glutamine-hydrolysing)